MSQNHLKDKNEFINFCNDNEIDSVLVEGGGGVYTWFIENNLADEIFLFYRPAFIGRDGINFFNGWGTERIESLRDYKAVRTELIDNNILMHLAMKEPLCLLA